MKKAKITSLIPSELTNSKVRGACKRGKLLNLTVLPLTPAAEITIELEYEHDILQLGLLLKKDRTWRYLLRKYNKQK